MATLIVTRHKGLVDWLNERGIEGEVKKRATEEDVKGKHVYGVLPYWLAAKAELFTEVSLELPLTEHGADLSKEEMDAHCPVMRTWRVTEVFDARKA